MFSPPILGGAGGGKVSGAPSRFSNHKDQRQANHEQENQRRTNQWRAIRESPLRHQPPFTGFCSFHHSPFTIHHSPSLHPSPPLSLGCQEIIGFTTHANLTNLPQNGPNPANSDGILTILPYTDEVLTKRKQMLEGRAPFRGGRFKNGHIRAGRSKPHPYLTNRY